MKRRPRIYIGFPMPDGEQRVLVVPLDGPSPYPLPSRVDLANHSPSGYSWGYTGSGPAQLALAILADHLGNADAAVAAHQEYKDRVIVWFEQDQGWVLTQHEIDEDLHAMHSPGAAA